MQLTGLDGVCAVVTGAAGGIGTAVTRSLIAAGAQVAAVDTAARPLRRLLDDVTAYESAAISTRVADVSDDRAAEAVLDQAEERWGPITLLVNAAGVLHTGSVTDFHDAEWHNLIATNATGVFLWSRAAARRMVAHRQGAIVTVASNCVSVPRSGMAAYAASKAAAGALTLGLGLELAPLGIRCNLVCPGSTDTPMLRQLAETDSALDQVVRGDLTAFRIGIPLGRVAAPQDVADAVLFLASQQARHITMHSLYVDGGAALHG